MEQKQKESQKEKEKLDQFDSIINTSIQTLAMVSNKLDRIDLGRINLDNKLNLYLLEIALIINQFTGKDIYLNTKNFFSFLKLKYKSKNKNLKRSKIKNGNIDWVEFWSIVTSINKIESPYIFEEIYDTYYNKDNNKDNNKDTPTSR